MRYDNVLKTTKYVLFYIFQFEKNVSLPIVSGFRNNSTVLITILIVLKYKILISIKKYNTYILSKILAFIKGLPFGLKGLKSFKEEYRHF